MGQGGGRCLPPAPRCAKRAPGHAAPPGTAGTPSWALAAERGRCGRTARPPALPGVPAAEPGGSAPVGLGHEQAWGPPALPQGCSKTAAAPGLLQSWRCGEGGERRARGARAHRGERGAQETAGCHRLGAGRQRQHPRVSALGEFGHPCPRAGTAGVTPGLAPPAAHGAAGRPVPVRGPSRGLSRGLRRPRCSKPSPTVARSEAAPRGQG